VADLLSRLWIRLLFRLQEKCSAHSLYFAYKAHAAAKIDAQPCLLQAAMIFIRISEKSYKFNSLTNKALISIKTLKLNKIRIELCCCKIRVSRNSLDKYYRALAASTTFPQAVF
jgi:hypothetical protein